MINNKPETNRAYLFNRASLVAQTLKNPPATQETWVQHLGQEDPLEKGTATHSSILAWRIHGQRSLAGCSPWGYMTEHVCMRVEGHGLVAINW